MRTGNPAFTMGGTVFQDWARTDRRSTTMTVAGTAYKALALLVVLTIGAAISWTQVENATLNGGLLLGSLIGGIIFACMTVIRPAWAPYTAPVYSLCQGFLLGAI